MKLRIILTLLAIIFSNKAYAVACVDLVTHEKLTGLDKKLQSQKELLAASEDILEDIKGFISGRSLQTSSILNNTTFHEDISSLRIPHLIKDKKSKLIIQKFKRLYPLRNLEVPETKIKKTQQRRYFQAGLQQSIVNATYVINNSNIRKQEIESLAIEADQKNTLKESVDFQNKLLLEILTDLKNNNILLASIARDQATGQYKGLINIKKEAKGDNDYRPTPLRNYPRSGFK